jgi:cytochrome c2
MHGAPQQAALWNRKEGRGEDPQSRYCRSCHDAGGEETGKVPPRLENHLVYYPGKGMVSRMFTPRQRSLLDMTSTFPLYSREGIQEKGRGFLSCASCHDVHSWEPDTASSGAGMPLEGDLRNSFLKVRNTFAVGRSFCRECHGEDSLELYRSYHFPEGRGPGSPDPGP